MRSHLRWWHNPKRAIAIAALGPPHVESSCCRLACRGNGIEESEKSCDLIIEVQRRLDVVEALVRKEEKRWLALVLLDPAQPIFMVDGRSEVRAQAATSCLFESQPAGAFVIGGVSGTAIPGRIESMGLEQETEVSPSCKGCGIR
jgi:hypothetical protein